MPLNRFYLISLLVGQTVVRDPLNECISVAGRWRHVAASFLQRIKLLVYPGVSCGLDKQT